MAGCGKHLLPVPLCRGAGGALGRGCADAGEGGARRRVIELRRKAAEHHAEPMVRDWCLDHAGKYRFVTKALRASVPC